VEEGFLAQFDNSYHGKEVALVAKDAHEIASDITIAWMQLLAQDTAPNGVSDALSQEQVSQYYSAVCKTVLQCVRSVGMPEVCGKPENW
jgi:hypothetical protein